MRVVEKKKSCRGTEISSAYEYVFYISATEPKMVRIRVSKFKADIYEEGRISYSSDDGRTWSEDYLYQVTFGTPIGVKVRKDYTIPVVDPYTGRLIFFTTMSVFSLKDHMLDALNYSFATYKVSEDSGTTWLFEERIIQKSDELDTYTPQHPVDSVWLGRNAAHLCNIPFFNNKGQLIVSMSITRLNPDNTLFCPPGAFSYHEMIVLIGTWQKNGHISWEASEKIIIEPDVSTRGANEGAIAEMPDGRFLMVIRGSNLGNLALPGYKWYTVSSDGCHTWSRVKPWTYTDGTPVLAPASYSRILKHSNGNYYWIGIVCDQNPSGNDPDKSIYIGEIDPQSFLLRKESIIEIDRNNEDDPGHMHLRNFSLYEERTTTDIVMRMCREWIDQKSNIRGDTYVYRIRV